MRICAVLLCTLFVRCSATEAEALVAKSRGIGRTSGGGRQVLTNNYAVNLDATNEIMSTAADIWSGNYTALTVSFWYKSTGSITLADVYIAKSTAREFDIRTGQTDTTKMRITVGTGGNYCETDANRVDTSWHHFFIVYNGSGAGNSTRCYIYVDGVDRTSSYTGTIPTSITDGNGYIYVNGTSGYTLAAGGKYDEIAIWREDKRAFATQIYNGGRPGVLTSFAPLIWWRMGDHPLDDIVQPGHVEDVTGNGYDLDYLQFVDSGDKVTDVP